MVVGTSPAVHDATDSVVEGVTSLMGSLCFVTHSQRGVLMPYVAAFGVFCVNPRLEDGLHHVDVLGGADFIGLDIGLFSDPGGRRLLSGRLRDCHEL